MIEDYYVPGIEIERYTETNNEVGNTVKDWVPHLTIEGSIDAISGDEQKIADALAVKATHMLFCSPCDITEKDRVKYQGKIYQVRFVDDPMGFNHHLEVLLEVTR